MPPVTTRRMQSISGNAWRPASEFLESEARLAGDNALSLNHRANVNVFKAMQPSALDRLTRLERPATDLVSNRVFTHFRIHRHGSMVADSFL